MAIIPAPASKNPMDCTGKNMAFNDSKSQIPAAYKSLYVAFSAPAQSTLIVPAANNANASLRILLYKSRCKIIAAIPKGPSIYSPIKNYERNLKRANLILSEMLDDEVISKEEYDEKTKEYLSIGYDEIVWN